MILVNALLLTTLIATPISNGVAWWFWIRKAPGGHLEWRRTVLLVGLVSVSINTMMYYTWFAFRLALHGAPIVWTAKEICASLALFLVPAALGGAILGKGKSRIPLAFCAVLGFILWVPIGVL